MRVLVAEDQPRVADAIARGLRQQGVAVDVALDGEAALYRARVYAYDVLLLDRDLPVLHGDEVCRVLRDEQPDLKILMVSGDRFGVVSGLALGADDYVAKPFRFAELVARVHALHRRAGPAPAPKLRFGDIALDPARREVTRGGLSLSLSVKEFGVLELLLRSAGAVVTAEALLAAVWDENVDPFTNSLRMTVMKLRRKLGEPAVVDTVPGQGYRLI
jgi:DNA-binding response OmpR family regulator